MTIALGGGRGGGQRGLQREGTEEEGREPGQRRFLSHLFTWTPWPIGITSSRRRGDPGRASAARGERAAPAGVRVGKVRAERRAAEPGTRRPFTL